MAQLFANNATSTLASGVIGTDNTLVLATGEGARFPSPTGSDYFLITLTQGVGLETSWEIVKCTARTTDTLTVTRAQESTTAASFASGSKVELRITKGSMDGKASLLANVFTGQQTFAEAINEAHGADIASAGTINLTTATGNLVDVTGTTTITSITLADGYERTVRFTGALTLTHGASLVLPGSANITTAAGDFAIFRGYAAGVVRCVNYTKASGAPVVSAAGGSLIYISTITASSSATVDFEAGLDGTYDNYVIFADSLTSTGGLNITALLKVGGAYQTTNYNYVVLYATSAGSVANASVHTNNNNIDTKLNIYASGSARFTCHIYNPSNTTLKKSIEIHGSAFNETNSVVSHATGFYTGANTALQGVRFTGTFTTGTFRLYGIKNS